MIPATHRSLDSEVCIIGGRRLDAVGGCAISIEVLVIEVDHCEWGRFCEWVSVVWIW
ncbi:hypothetical protein OF83DRAFT_1116294 [Amylostereum chailletii]|nr:hypothetical protein OF83DRAFT_1116294 [Amylostereum chailletii]